MNPPAQTRLPKPYQHSTSRQINPAPYKQGLSPIPNLRSCVCVCVRVCVYVCVCARTHTCVQENTCKDGFIVDKEDSSVTRSAEYLEGLFKVFFLL